MFDHMVGRTLKFRGRFAVVTAVSAHDDPDHVVLTGRNPAGRETAMTVRVDSELLKP